jgi:anti-anti-sigma regulatory factor
VRWRRSSAHPTATKDPEPLVLTVTEPVTRATAAGLVARVGRIAAGNPVVIDLTAIPEFDSDGAAAIIGLQESYGADRVTVIGFRQATARLVGSDDPMLVTPEPLQPAQQSGWVVRRLRAIAVVQAEGNVPPSTDQLEPVLASALASRAGIVVLDLRGVQLSRVGLQAIAFASSTAALNGQEMLVVNVDSHMGERLRRAGLSSTTYVAPEPLADS